MIDSIEIHTDGACRRNPGPGGWGVVWAYKTTKKTEKGAERLTTNNRMEMMAVIVALETLTRACNVKLYTDSQYVMRGMQEWLPEWKKRNWLTADRKPVKNMDLWQRLEQACQRHTVDWHWVKGHSGDAGNELADRLANEAIDEMLMESA